MQTYGRRYPNVGEFKVRRKHRMNDRLGTSKKLINGDEELREF